MHWCSGKGSWSPFGGHGFQSHKPREEAIPMWRGNKGSGKTQGTSSGCPGFPT